MLTLWLRLNTQMYFVLADVRTCCSNDIFTSLTSSLTFARKSSFFSGAAMITTPRSKNLHGLILSNACLCVWAEVVPQLLLRGKMWRLMCYKPPHCRHQNRERTDNTEKCHLILSLGEQVFKRGGCSLREIYGRLWCNKMILYPGHFLSIWLMIPFIHIYLSKILCS